MKSVFFSLPTIFTPKPTTHLTRVRQISLADVLMDGEDHYGGLDEGNAEPARPKLRLFRMDVTLDVLFGGGFGEGHFETIGEGGDAG